MLPKLLVPMSSLFLVCAVLARRTLRAKLESQAKCISHPHILPTLTSSMRSLCATGACVGAAARCGGCGGLADAG